jgi:hypothetical protein
MLQMRDYKFFNLTKGIKAAEFRVPKEKGKHLN